LEFRRVLCRSPTAFVKATERCKTPARSRNWPGRDVAARERFSGVLKPGPRFVARTLSRSFVLDQRFSGSTKNVAGATSTTQPRTSFPWREHYRERSGAVNLTSTALDVPRTTIHTILNTFRILLLSRARAPERAIVRGRIRPPRRTLAGSPARNPAALRRDVRAFG